MACLVVRLPSFGISSSAATNIPPSPNPKPQLINPGNPTGQVLSREDLQVICRFCARNGIVLLADEVYQRNIYARGKEFVSAKKVALEDPGCHNLQLVSFHSTSKGFIGECGRRGGYMELHHIDPYVQTQLYKLASAGLCSGVSGQVMTSLMVKPPAPGGESHERFVREEHCNLRAWLRQRNRVSAKDGARVSTSLVFLKTYVA